MLLGRLKTSKKKYLELSRIIQLEFSRSFLYFIFENELYNINNL